MSWDKKLAKLLKDARDALQRDFPIGSLISALPPNEELPGLYRVSSYAAVGDVDRLFISSLGGKRAGSVVVSDPAHAVIRQEELFEMFREDGVELNQHSSN